MICGWDKTVSEFEAKITNFVSLMFLRAPPSSMLIQMEPVSKAIFFLLAQEAPSPMVCWIKDTIGICPTKRLRSLADGVSTLLVIATLSLEILVTFTTSKRMVGNSSVCGISLLLLLRLFTYLPGNYDVSQMHYEGPGNVAGAPGGGYGYDLRVEGRSSANPPPVVATA